MSSTPDIRSLSTAPRAEIYQSFIRAFSDYFIPMKMTEEAFFNRHARENVDYALSGGVFEEETICAFIHTATGSWNGLKTAYNAGTGVVPTSRKQGLGYQLYQRLFEWYRESGYEQTLLEVIRENTAAIKLYEKCGLSIGRKLDSFSGAVKGQPEPPSNLQIRAVSQPDWELFRSWWDYQPSWQNSEAACKRIPGDFTVLQVEKEDKPIAWGFVKAESGSVPLFAVHPDHRRQGIGRWLFQEMQQVAQNELRLINVDQESTGTTAFLQQIGLKFFLGQYEMTGRL